MTIALQVKKAILNTYGDTDDDPSTLEDDKNMSDFGFADIQYLKLTQRFNQIMQQTKPNNSVSSDDVQKCSTVKDCVDLVTSKS